VSSMIAAHSPGRPGRGARRRGRSTSRRATAVSTGPAGGVAVYAGRRTGPLSTRRPRRGRHGRGVAHGLLRPAGGLAGTTWPGVTARTTAALSAGGRCQHRGLAWPVPAAIGQRLGSLGARGPAPATRRATLAPGRRSRRRSRPATRRKPRPTCRRQGCSASTRAGLSSPVTVVAMPRYPSSVRSVARCCASITAA